MALENFFHYIFGGGGGRSNKRKCFIWDSAQNMLNLVSLWVLSAQCILATKFQGMLYI